MTDVRVLYLGIYWYDYYKCVRSICSILHVCIHMLCLRVHYIITGLQIICITNP